MPTKSHGATLKVVASINEDGKLKKFCTLARVIAKYEGGQVIILPTSANRSNCQGILDS